MSDLLSGNIHFAGLGSGTDFNTIIDGLIQIEQLRVTRLEASKVDLEDKITESQDLNTKLLSLKTSLETMDSLGEFLVKNSESSDSSILTATPGADALAG
jgi:flagellar hook-associated protein 2